LGRELGKASHPGPSPGIRLSPRLPNEWDINKAKLSLNYSLLIQLKIDNNLKGKRHLLERKNSVFKKVDCGNI